MQIPVSEDRLGIDPVTLTLIATAGAGLYRSVDDFMRARDAQEQAKKSYLAYMEEQAKTSYEQLFGKKEKEFKVTDLLPFAGAAAALILLMRS